MDTESAISIFRKLPETKEQVQHYTRLIRDAVLEGEVDPLDFISQVTALETLFKGLKDDILIKDVVLTEAEKYKEKSFEHGYAKFQVKEVGVKYDFSVCQDSDYEKLTVELNQLTEQKKQREAFLKTIQPGIEVYGSDGRQLEIPLKTSTTQVIVMLK
jgi:hypothetical protein